LTDADAEHVKAVPDERAEDLYENAPCGYLSALPGGDIVRVNRTLLTWTGYTREELLGRRFQDLLTAGGRIYHETHYAPLLRMQGAVREIALDLVRADGSRLPVLVNSVLRTDDDGQPALVRTTVFDATHRRQYERELVRARNRETAARERTERLQRLSAALAAAVDTEQMTDAVVGALADDLRADEVVVALLDAGRDRLQTVGRHRAGADAEAEPATGAIDVDASLQRVLRGGRPLLVANGDAHSDVAAVTGLSAGAFAARALLPLAARGEPVGMVVVSFLEPRAFDEEEQLFMEACAAQCSQALERARLYEHERSVAHTLQKSLLASRPPQDPRVDVEACYLPAVQSLEVGGDWHDTFMVDDDTVVAVVGDVVGRGIEAATAMGQLRSATRALAGAQLGPAEVLRHLDGFVQHLPRARFATAAVAALDLRTRRLRYACAGHPPPLVVQPGEPATALWDGRSAPLGVSRGGPPRRHAELELQPGARLVLYTDGLVERRDASLDDAIGRLSDELARRRAAALGPLLSELVQAFTGDAARDDDVCLLCLEYHGPDGAARA
jgi:PAS domain S-box-containing protein